MFDLLMVKVSTEVALKCGNLGKGLTHVNIDIECASVASTR